MDSPAIIIARFLKANHYDDTLNAFLHEAALPPEAGTISQGDLTLEKIIEEKQIFDLTSRIEKVGAGDEDRQWSVAASSVPSRIFSIPSSSNVLHVSAHHINSEVPHASSKQILLATTADRRIHFFDPDQNFSLLRSIGHLQDSPTLSCDQLDGESFTTIISGMSGQTLLYDYKTDQVLEERRDHKKYIVSIATCDESSITWVATAGWDAQVFLYQVCGTRGMRLGDPVASLTAIPTNPESITFIKHPDIERPVLLVTRRDSTSLYYYGLPSVDQSRGQMCLLGSQNLAPHSNAWIAFSPSSIAVSPRDPTLLAVATSALPHMKLIIVRILIPTLASSTIAPAAPITQAAQSRAELAIQDREEAAIQVHVSTLAPQTPYSTPKVVWRPDGSGVWVNGDDGVLRGLEATTGKIVTTLKDGHEPGSKIRSIWCGNVYIDERQEEWVVSGGFDHRLVVWRP